MKLLLLAAALLLLPPAARGGQLPTMDGMEMPDISVPPECDAVVGEFVQCFLPGMMEGMVDTTGAHECADVDIEGLFALLPSEQMLNSTTCDEANEDIICKEGNLGTCCTDDLLKVIDCVLPTMIEGCNVQCMPPLDDELKETVDEEDPDRDTDAAGPEDDPCAPCVECIPCIPCIGKDTEECKVCEPCYECIPCLGDLPDEDDPCAPCVSCIPCIPCIGKTDTEECKECEPCNACIPCLEDGVPGDGEGEGEEEETTDPTDPDGVSAPDTDAGYRADAASAIVAAAAGLALLV